MITIRCSYKHDDCFANIGGNKCRLLSEPLNRVECPFYKTEEQVDNERIMAHQHLKMLGREDLINMYEYNISRTW